MLPVSAAPVVTIENKKTNRRGGNFEDKVTLLISISVGHLTRENKVLPGPRRILQWMALITTMIITNTIMTLR